MSTLNLPATPGVSALVQGISITFGRWYMFDPANGLSIFYNILTAYKLVPQKALKNADKGL